MSVEVKKKNGKSRPNRRDHILRESAMLFQERGFGGATMRDIAVRVGIEAGSMYNHIASKQELLEAICFRIADLYSSQLKEIETLYLSPAEKIEALVRLHVRILIEDGASVFVANNEWKSLNPQKLDIFKRMQTSFEERCKALLQAGIESGVFKPVNTSVALHTLLSSVRWVGHWYVPDRGIQVEALENDIVTLVMGGLLSA